MIKHIDWFNSLMCTIPQGNTSVKHYSTIEFQGLAPAEQVTRRKRKGGITLMIVG